MLTSMTGFGRAVCESPLGRLTAEIQSVNRKYLEIQLSLPKEFSRFEQDVRKWVAEIVSRGQVGVKIWLLPNEAALSGFIPDAAVLKALKKRWEKVAKEAGADPKSIDLPFLLQYLPPKQEEVSEKDFLVFRQCVEKALQGLLQMKKAEGKALLKDLEGRLKGLEGLIGKIEKASPDVSRRMREKLLEKMAEVLKPSAETDERLLREVALFAERVDIAEEITRFRSHVAQFKGLFKEGLVGRKMDFLIQEMGREVNTIGSKAMEAKISHLVVEMKSELEKMREQIQNIE